MNWLWTGYGRLVPGDGRGRTLGFPTANVELAPGVKEAVPLPEPAVYAGWAWLGLAADPVESKADVAAAKAASIHIGPRPTVDDYGLAFEVHMLDFPDQDLYGQDLAVAVVSHVRDIQKFDSLAELTAAIAGDCEEVRRRLLTT